MRHISRLLLLCAGGSFLLLTGCQTGQVASGSYHVTAYRPHDPSKVKVKLSLSTQNLYVMEGDRLLMAVQANVGKPGAPTPTGHFTIYNKEKDRRRQSEPDRGYPMAYWCEFAPPMDSTKALSGLCRIRMDAFGCIAKRLPDSSLWSRSARR